jgi:hypothetical protein
MIRPDRPSTTKLIAVVQWAICSSGLKRWIEVQRGQHREHADHQPAAPEGHRPVTDLAPGLAPGLDQHVGFTALHGGIGIRRLAGTHFTPDRRVVARLRHLALLLLLDALVLRLGLRERRARDDGQKDCQAKPGE